MYVQRGMTLIDVIVGTALMLVVFLGLFGLLRASLMVSSLVKSEAAANAIANDQMEYIRSLPYDSVGTVGGIPAGTIQQNSTTTEDGVAYGVRTFIAYYDDPADGLGGADTNGITTDYKKIKVTVSYSAGKQTRQITVVSNYAPSSIETTVNGGTLQIIVVNASGVAVPGASVHITNSSISPSVDLTTFSDASGTVYLPGAATSTEYAVSVSKAGYSTAQTYARDATNQNPTPGYLTVVKNQTTSATFAIDALSSLVLKTFSPIQQGSFSDSFANNSKLISQTNTTVSGGALTLSSDATTGNARSTTTAPAYLYAWGVASSTMTTPAGTTAVIHVVDGSGSLVPDSALPGNSVGYSSFPITLSNLSTTTYPVLGLVADLTTAATTTLPSITGWSLTYQYGPTPLPNVAFTLTGSKTIGSTGGGAPLYKTTVSDSTDSGGFKNLSLEWDSYALSLSGYDVVDACSAPPYALSPGTTLTESLTLDTRTTNAILITVTDAQGIPVPGATVTLTRSGYTNTVTSSACAAAYFGSLTSASDYTVTISKTGYTTNTLTGVSVSGHTFYAASF